MARIDIRRFSAIVIMGSLLGCSGSDGVGDGLGAADGGEKRDSSTGTGGPSDPGSTKGDATTGDPEHGDPGTDSGSGSSVADSGGSLADVGAGNNAQGCPILAPGNSRCDDDAGVLLCHYPGNTRWGRACDLIACSPGMDWYCENSACPTKMPQSGSTPCPADMSGTDQPCVLSDGAGNRVTCTCTAPSNWDCY
jgi:hypothetical protein